MLSVLSAQSCSIPPLLARSMKISSSSAGVLSSSSTSTLTSTSVISPSSWLPQCRACLRIGALDIIDGADPKEFVDLLFEQHLPDDVIINSSQNNFDFNSKSNFLAYFNECTHLQITQLQLQRELQGVANNASGCHRGRCHFLCGACKEVVEIAHQFISTARMSDGVIRKHLAAKNTCSVSSAGNNKECEETLNWKYKVRECESEESLISSSSQTTHENINIFQMELETQIQATTLNDGIQKETNINEADSVIGPEVVLIESTYEDCSIHNEEEHVDDNQFLIAQEYVTAEQREKEEETSENNAEISFHQNVQIQRVNNTESETEFLDFSSSDELGEIDILNDESAVAVITVDPNIKTDVKNTRNRKRLKCFQFNCEFCCNRYKYQRELFQHYEKCHYETEANEKCKRCNQRFVTKSARNIHNRIEHEHKEYRDCERCGNAVLSTFYRQHLQRHHQRKQRFYCNKCDTIFKTRSQLQKHMDTHEESRERHTTCVECGKNFYSLSGLKTHENTHNEKLNERSMYTCSICNKVFMRQCSLKLHMQLHRGDTMNCKDCGKQFVRRKDLERHERFHAGVHPFECLTCGRKFVMASHLKDHEQTHLGLRYKCTYCEKYFVNPIGLKQHYYSHIGMPFACKVCQRGFPTKGKIRRHLRGVHCEMLIDREQHIDELFTVEEHSNISLKREYVARIVINGEEESIKTKWKNISGDEDKNIS